MEIRVFIDRIEEDQAVLLVGEQGLVASWPVSLLPPGVREGEYCTVRWASDPSATAQAKARVEDLIRKLSQGGS